MMLQATGSSTLHEVAAEREKEIAVIHAKKDRGSFYLNVLQEELYRLTSLV